MTEPTSLAEVARLSLAEAVNAVEAYRGPAGPAAIKLLAAAEQAHERYVNQNFIALNREDRAAKHTDWLLRFRTEFARLVSQTEKERA